MPADVEIEEHGDGSKTVWLSDHDPMRRMKGMHGVCLHPDKAYIELKVRAYNRTPLSADVSLVGQRRRRGCMKPISRFFRRMSVMWPTTPSARRAIFRCARAVYYGVDYGERGAQRRARRTKRPRHFVPPHCGGKAPVDYRAERSFLVRQHPHCPAPTCAWARRRISSAATTTPRRRASSMSPTTISRPAKNNGPGATTSSAMPGTAI